MRYIYSALPLCFSLTLTGCGGVSASAATEMARTLRASDAAFSVVYEHKAEEALGASQSLSDYNERMQPYNDESTAIDGAYKCLLDAVIAEDPNAFACAPLVGHIITVVTTYVR